MATATASSSGPRYAPEDPSLPKPWKGLVDGKTGYLYFWNPETNVTQYERPALPPKSSSVPLSSSVQVQQSSHGQRRDNDDDDRYGRGSNGGSKFSAGARSHESARSGTVQSQNGTVGAGHGGSSTRGQGSVGVGSGSSAESYRRRHEITVSGDNVPPPFMSFEATGFPSEILREVRYLLQGGANVVRCAALFVGGLHIVGAPFYGGPILRRAFRITQVRGQDCCW